MDHIKENAKLILVYNAKVWVSASEQMGWFTFSSQYGRIVQTGCDPHPDINEYHQAVNAGGKRIFPGFHDSHIHVAMLGEATFSADLKGCTSIRNMQEIIKSCVEKNPDATWVTGRGWDQELLGRYPNKEDVDAVCSERPAKISRECYHVVVVNSKALEICGITRDTPDPEGGVIERYPPGHPQQGEPTGIIKEISALAMIDKYKRPSKEEKLNHIKTGLNLCLKSGLTSVHTIEEIHWNEYCELAKTNQLPIRVFLSCLYTERSSGNFPTPPGEKCGSLLSCDRVKLFVDGSLGACTAALSKPYTTQPGNCGTLTYSQESLNDLVCQANSEGFRLEIHVIGDRAAEVALTALERAGVTPERRPILTHCQFLREDLVDRMVRQNVIANIQPQFVPADAAMVLDRVHPDLLSWSYAWKSLLKKGIVCAGGSDSPVVFPGPLIGIYDAIYRPNKEGISKEQGSFRPEESLTVEEAVDCYTKAGAYTTMREHDLGQLEPGYMADFVVIEGEVDPVENPKHFRAAKVEQVWVAGKQVL